MGGRLPACAEGDGGIGTAVCICRCTCRCSPAVSKPLLLRHLAATHCPAPLFFPHPALPAPHLLQAETTLINFNVTQQGLEEALVALVVSRERADLEKAKAQLIVQVLSC